MQIKEIEVKINEDKLEKFNFEEIIELLKSNNIATNNVDKDDKK